MTAAEEQMVVAVFKAELEALYARMIVSPTVWSNAKWDVVRDEARNVIVSMRTWLAAKSHDEDWLEVEEVIVAPGLWNNLRAALNRRWPFAARPLRVRTIARATHRHYKTTYVCPHLDVPNLRTDDLHIAFLNQAEQP